MRARFAPLIGLLFLGTGCTVYQIVPSTIGELPAPPERQQLVFAMHDDPATGRVWVVHHALLTSRGLHGAFFQVGGPHAESTRTLDDQHSLRLLAPAYLYTVDPAWQAPKADGDTATIPYPLLRNAQLIELDRKQSRQRTTVAWISSFAVAGLLAALIVTAINSMTITMTW